jgi:hypothetical protein
MVSLNSWCRFGCCLVFQFNPWRFILPPRITTNFQIAVGEIFLIRWYCFRLIHVDGYIYRFVVTGVDFYAKLGVFRS